LVSIIYEENMIKWIFLLKDIESSEG